MTNKQGGLSFPIFCIPLFFLVFIYSIPNAASLNHHVQHQQRRPIGVANLDDDDFVHEGQERRLLDDFYDVQDALRTFHRKNQHLRPGNRINHDSRLLDDESDHDLSPVLGDEQLLVTYDREKLPVVKKSRYDYQKEMDPEMEFSNEWVVTIKGGHHEANRLAKHSDYHLVGPVG